MNYKIVAIGDSVTYGYLMSRSQTWIRLTEEALNISILNEGQNGDTSSGMLRRLPSLLTLQPKKIFIMGGVNDFFMGIPYITVEENLLAMIQMAEEKNVSVILGTPHQANLRRNSFFMDRSSVYRAVNQKTLRLREKILSLNYPVVDFYGAMEALWKKDPEQADSLYFDEVHLNAKGNAFFAQVAVDSKAFLPD